MNITNTFTKLIYAVLFSLLTSSIVSAQSVWLNDDTKYFSYEFLKPSFSGSADVGFLSGSHHLMFGGQVSESAMLIGNIAFCHANVESWDGRDKESSISNAYIGLRLLGNNEYVSNEIGVFLPMASDENFNATGFGFYSDNMNFELYAPDNWGIRYRIKTEKPIKDNGVFYSLYGGFTFSHNTELEEDNNFIFVDYGGQIGYRTPESLNLYAQVAGRVGLNDASEYGIDDKTSWLFGIGASYRKNNIEPGLSLDFPMDQPFKEFVDNVVAISVVFYID